MVDLKPKPRSRKIAFYVYADGVTRPASVPRFLVNNLNVSEALKLAIEIELHRQERFMRSCLGGPST
jgi:hypothetical protein